MVDITTLSSLGMIETGSHSIQEWEVMEDLNGNVYFISHDGGTEDSLGEVLEMFDLKEDNTLGQQLKTLNLSIS
jgi:hypothetical protein